MMTSVTAAYARWQVTSGATIFDQYDRPARPVTAQHGQES